jgi:predicted outer membrane repeat protein
LTISGLHHDPSEVIWSWSGSSFLNSRALVSDGNTFVRIANLTIQDFSVVSNVTVRGEDNDKNLQGDVLNTRYEGGALDIKNTTMEIYNVHFLNNSAGQGGAVAFSKSNVSVVLCKFTNNYALIAGGGLSARGTTLRINDTDFVENYVTGNIATQSFGEGGGIVYLGEASDQLQIFGGTFNNNTAPEAGGAIHVQALDHVMITGTHFYYNKAIGDGVCLITSSACQVRGGAIFSTVPGMMVVRAKFVGNTAQTTVTSQLAEGGAIYTTSAYAKIPILKMSQYIGCEFTGNSATTFGGALYVLNQYIAIQGGSFTKNFAGTSSVLFSDSSCNGGALWFSATGSGSEISQVVDVKFDDNYVWGGGGGAVYVTTTPNFIIFDACIFQGNTAISTYTFPAKGGAVMMSHNSVCRVDNCHFYNNTAVPRTDLGDRPRTLSGTGGAVFVQSANITIIYSYFQENLAFSGQFDGGPSGGAVTMEDAAASIVNQCTFVNNGAVGYVGYSTYGSSGTGGAIYLSFCAAAITATTFSDNWVSAGGSYSSSGGAVAVFFDYTSSKSSGAQGVTLTDCSFTNNYAFAGTCEAVGAGANAGEGGALAVLGTQSPGTSLKNVSFHGNMAVSRTGVQILSYGGALVTSLASNVTGEYVSFANNVAFFGLGNDVGVLEGQDGLVNSVELRHSSFSAISEKTMIQLEVAMFKKANNICNMAVHALTYGKGGRHNKVRLSGKDVKKGESRGRHSHSYGGVPLQSRAGTGHRQLRGRRDNGWAQHNSPRSTSKTKIISLSAATKNGAAAPAAQQSVGDFNIPDIYHYPAVIVTNGDIDIFNSSFGGDYHVFVGDYREIFLGQQAQGGATTCNAKIHASTTVEAMSLTAFRSNVETVGNAKEKFLLEKLLLMNATLYVGNDLVVRSNSSIVDSVIAKANVTEYSQNPKVTFLDNVYTGFNIFDLEALAQFSKNDLLRLHSFPAVIGVDGCTLEVKSAMEFSTPRVSTVPPYDNHNNFIGTIVVEKDDPKTKSKGVGSVSGDGAIDDMLTVHLSQDALINITTEGSLTIYSPTYVKAETETSPTIKNSGVITLDGSKLGLLKKINTLPSGGDIEIDDDGTAKKFTRDSNSLNSTLTVYGSFAQTPSGILVITLNRTGQIQPVLNLVSNESFFGHYGFRFGEEPSLSFYDPPADSGVSSWAIATYEKVKRGKDDDPDPVKLYAPQGLGFDAKISQVGKYVNPANRTEKNAFVSTYTIDAISCEDVIPYSAFAKDSDNGLYPCFVCLSNSSCNFCMDNGCAESTTECSANGGIKYRTTCCDDDCNSHGQCVASSDNQAFVCECSPFYTGDACKSLSNISIVIITLSGALIIVIGVVIYNYRLSLFKKSQVLEELRQGLLFDNEGRDLDSINDAYIQSLQQGLILKDASVKFKEIKLEKQVGEGSFGVVYKAMFRGASVAVKRMRPMFAALTNNDIEEFNKEAYMMSRLRHPNIVLVMGISYVDPETVTLPRRRSNAPSMDQLEEEDEFGNDSKKKENFVKCVCIVTEFLEQGSLADILYGPRRLPAEVWTYDLILTCALQAARGMLYLHSHSPPICHRDLKSSNLVVDDHWVVKVTDFGMSRIVPESVIDIEKGLGDQASDRASVGLAPSPTRYAASASSNHSDDSLSSAVSSNYAASRGTQSGHSVVDISSVSGSESYRGNNHKTGSRENLEMTSNLGTVAWCAPEVLTASSKARYSVKVDVYSFGMVLWELWERKRPYEDLHSRFDIMDAIRSGNRPAISADCPPAYRSLIQRCWQGDPSRRPMFQYIVRYLKDELARVKRKRERAPMRNSSAENGGGGGGGGEKYGGAVSSVGNTESGGGYASSSSNTNSNTTSAFDSMRGQINRILPWATGNSSSSSNNTNNNSGSGSNAKDISAAADGAYVMMDEETGSTNPIHTSNPHHDGSTAAMSASEPMKIGRDSLDQQSGPATTNALLQDPDINFLAASPAISSHGGGGFEDSFLSLQERQRKQRETQESAQLRTMHAYQAKVNEKSIQASLNHAQQTATGGAVSSPIGSPTGAGANPAKKQIVRSSRQSREAYVMKFSGWQPSQPDAGLPPSSGGTTPRGDSFLTAAFSGMDRNSTGTGGGPLTPKREHSDSIDIEKIPPRVSRLQQQQQLGDNVPFGSTPPEGEEGEEEEEEGTASLKQDASWSGEEEE